MSRLLFVAEDNPIHKVRPGLYSALVAAQGTRFETVFSNASELLGKVFSDLKLSLDVPSELSSHPANDLADRPFSDLVAYFRAMLESIDFPLEAVPGLSNSLAQRTHLVRAFAEPDRAVSFIVEKVGGIVAAFRDPPRTYAVVAMPVMCSIPTS